MKIRILGSGTSIGVPEVGCRCEVCTSGDPRDCRLRTSALIEVDDTAILMDCGPDFRQQMMSWGKFRKIDAVLVTHEHYDHVGGLDDLRPFCKFGQIPVYANHRTAEALRQRMPYCFVDNSYPGVPNVFLREAAPDVPFTVNGIEILPIEVMHGKLPILGYVVGRRLAYITDMHHWDESNVEKVRGVDLLIINALRKEPHLTHQTVDEAVAVAKLTGARKTCLIHMSHHVGLHSEISQELPDGVFYAYDGMEIEI